MLAPETKKPPIVIIWRFLVELYLPDGGEIAGLNTDIIGNWMPRCHPLFHVLPIPPHVLPAHLEFCTMQQNDSVLGDNAKLYLRLSPAIEAARP